MPTSPHSPMILVAHRAGNRPETIGPVLSVADVVELDVHPFRGRLEVRHGKVLWPFARVWEQWELLPADTPRPTLSEIMQMVPDDAHVWVDLKGFTRGFSRRVLLELGRRRPLTVSARSWWVRVGQGAARRAQRCLNVRFCLRC